MHIPLTQSDGRVHLLLSGHRGHDLPPQSMSVSSRFLRPSVQVGATTDNEEVDSFDCREGDMKKIKFVCLFATGEKYIFYVSNFFSSLSMLIPVNG